MAANGSRNGRSTSKPGKKPIVTVTITTRPGKSGNRTPGPPPSHSAKDPGSRPIGRGR